MLFIIKPVAVLHASLVSTYNGTPLVISDTSHMHLYYFILADYLCLHQIIQHAQEVTIWLVMNYTNMRIQKP